MSIRTKLRINLSAFIVLAIIMISNEASMRLADDLHTLLHLPIV